MIFVPFQVLFHSPPGVLFIFPSQYFYTIAHFLFLGLKGGPFLFKQSFTAFVLLLLEFFFFNYGAFTLFGKVSQTFSYKKKELEPKFDFRSPLLTKSLLLSFPIATKMFQFTMF